PRLIDRQSDPAAHWRFPVSGASRLCLGYRVRENKKTSSPAAINKTGRANVGDAHVDAEDRTGRFPLAGWTEDRRATPPRFFDAHARGIGSRFRANVIRRLAF